MTDHSPQLGEKPDNYLIWAALVTVCCCMPVGIVALVRAMKVDSLWYSGQVEASRAASASAKRFVVASAVLGVVTLAVAVIVAALQGSPTSAPGA